MYRQWKGHKWANPDDMHLQQLMRYTYSNPKDTKQKGNISRNDMINNYSLDIIGSLLEKHFERVQLLCKEKLIKNNNNNNNNEF